jgi:transposase
VRVTSVLRKLLGLGVSAVISAWELVGGGEGCRPKLVVRLRPKSGARARCGRCGMVAPFFDHGGGERRWRHLDVGFATSELVSAARRVSCPEHGPTVVEVSWTRHGSWFSRAFEDLVCFDAICSNKLAAARRYAISWRAVNNICVRVATEALGRVDLLSGLVAVAIDEVKYKKGQRYLTVVCDHMTGKVIWAQKGRTKETVGEFFDALGEKRAGELQFVSCDGAEWIRTVIAERAPGATVCLDTFHLVSWATSALDEVRREEWNHLRRTGGREPPRSSRDCAGCCCATGRTSPLVRRRPSVSWSRRTSARCGRGS